MLFIPEPVGSHCVALFLFLFFSSFLCVAVLEICHPSDIAGEPKQYLPQMPQDFCN